MNKCLQEEYVRASPQYCNTFSPTIVFFSGSASVASNGSSSSFPVWVGWPTVRRSHVLKVFPSSSHVVLDLWLQGVAIVLGQVQTEFNPNRIEFATLSLYVGLIVGALTWGILADIIGRKLSFNVRFSHHRSCALADPGILRSLCASLVSSVSHLEALPTLLVSVLCWLASASASVASEYRVYRSAA